jgi:nucleotide-binding universal stress UspA family protein
MDAIQKILVPTDFSEQAEEAFRAAVGLAEAVGAKVILFHVAQPPAVMSDDGWLVTESPEAADLRDRLQRIQSPDPKIRVEHQVIVAAKSTASHILEILDVLGCNLIVMGTRKQSRLKHFLFGSVVEEVTRRARCPVMVVKAPAHPRNASAREAVQATGA